MKDNIVQSTIRSDIEFIVKNPQAKEAIDKIWDEIGEKMRLIHSEIPQRLAMPRQELSFHDHVKLLGYLCVVLKDIPGDIVEIGLWKGKSTSFMKAVSELMESTGVGPHRRTIGIDPLELPNQQAEFAFYQKFLFPEGYFIRNYSERAVSDFYELNPKAALLHIDGGHLKEHVVADFLLYAPSVVSGGIIVFDDYNDNKYSPEVKPAVDMLNGNGFFDKFEVIGAIEGFENSFLIRKK